MKLEDRYNARSSFYFLALDPEDRDLPGTTISKIWRMKWAPFRNGAGKSDFILVTGDHADLG